MKCLIRKIMLPRSYRATKMPKIWTFSDLIAYKLQATRAHSSPSFDIFLWISWPICSDIGELIFTKFYGDFFKEWHYKVQMSVHIVPLTPITPLFERDQTIENFGKNEKVSKFGEKFWEIARKSILTRREGCAIYPYNTHHSLIRARQWPPITPITQKITKKRAKNKL